MSLRKFALYGSCESQAESADPETLPNNRVSSKLTNRENERMTAETPSYAKYSPNGDRETDHMSRLIVEPLGEQLDYGRGYTGRSTEMATSSKAIARMAEPCRLTPQELEQQKIIHSEMEDISIADKYREIRTKLLAFSQGQNRVTLVTSVAPQSGCTHVTLNLAAAFAFDHTKTSMVIDCNVRNPQLHSRLLIEPQDGLTDFIEHHVIGLDNIIYATGIERMRLIPAGSRRESSSELFTSMRMRAMLDVLRNRYRDRHIFLDAPAVLQSADTRILTEICDQVVLVVPYGKVDAGDVNRAIETVGRDKLAGVVANDLQ